MIAQIGLQIGLVLLIVFLLSIPVGRYLADSQTSGYQWRRFFQCQRGTSLRESDAADQLAVDDLDGAARQSTRGLLRPHDRQPPASLGTLPRHGRSSWIERPLWSRSSTRSTGDILADQRRRHTPADELEGLYLPHAGDQRANRRPCSKSRAPTCSPR